jgi:hypothetical protein
MHIGYSRWVIRAPHKTGRKYPHEKCDNFHIRTQILANLGFLKSYKKYLSNGDHKTQEEVRDKIPNKKR